MISVKNLTKTFDFAVKDKERSALSNFFSPSRKTVEAVRSITFEVEKGEALAFIGPNGAGKSTTIKMLTGILWPTSGKIRISGLNPQVKRKQLSYKIGTVFGQRSQLVYNLPVKDSFSLFGKIYEVPEKETNKRIDELVELFELESFIDSPVRKLSLGQRMRCEIALALIHKPKIIFLDEPTIGLDVVAKRKLRETLKKLNKENNVTLFLTSHDTGDIEALCERTIIVNNGQIMLDEATEEIKRKFMSNKIIEIYVKGTPKEVNIPGVKLVSKDKKSLKFKVDTKQHSLNERIREILDTYKVDDLDVSNTSLEDIIEKIYKE